jgi:hypothetical protein
VITSCNGTLPTSSSTFCRLIERSFKGATRISLEIDGQDVKSDSKVHPKQLHVRRKPRISLSPIPSLMSDHKSQITERDLNGLALILAYALLQLYDEDPDGPFCWLNPYWENCLAKKMTPQWTKYINFFYHGRISPGKLDFQQPYLSSSINEKPEVAQIPFDNLEDALHQAPCILDLGKTILEMQLLYHGLPIDFKSEEESSDSEEENEWNINSEYIEAAGQLERYEAELDPWYFKAVDACLNPSPAEKMSIKEYIFRMIVRPLEHNYYINSATIEQVQKQLEELQMKPDQNASQYCTVVEERATRSSFCVYGDNLQVSMNNER